VVHEFSYENMDDLRKKLTIQLANSR